MTTCRNVEEARNIHLASQTGIHLESQISFPVIMYIYTGAKSVRICCAASLYYDSETFIIDPSNFSKSKTGNWREKAMPAPYMASSIPFHEVAELQRLMTEEIKVRKSRK
jgi:hypothetical protein